jgi:hypothetical protein
MPDQRFDEILDLLHHHHQRATYGALGAVVDRPPRWLMAGCPRDHRHSWIVNQETGLPTGYGPEDMHPDLLVRDEVLRTSRQLEEWLREARRTNHSPTGGR